MSAGFPIFPACDIPVLVEECLRPNWQQTCSLCSNVTQQFLQLEKWFDNIGSGCVSLSGLFKHNEWNSLCFSLESCCHPKLPPYNKKSSMKTACCSCQKSSENVGAEFFFITLTNLQNLGIELLQNIWFFFLKVPQNSPRCRKMSHSNGKVSQTNNVYVMAKY